MKRSDINTRLCLAACAALLATPAAMAQKGSGTMTIIGPDGYVVTTTATPGLSGTQNAVGAGLPDGQYSYEIRPTGGTRTRTGDEPTPGDPDYAFGLPSKPEVQSGFFTVQNGSIVDPNLPETTSGESLNSAQ